MRDSELTETICRFLATVDGWSYVEDGPPLAGDVAVFYGSIDTRPDQAVSVRVYGGTEAFNGEPTTRRVQLIIRGAQRDKGGADDLADDALRILTSISRLNGISGIRRQSMTPLGADVNGREQRSENYLVSLDNPEASA